MGRGLTSTTINVRWRSCLENGCDTGVFEGACNLLKQLGMLMALINGDL
jgi:hypothetical protein